MLPLASRTHGRYVASAVNTYGMLLEALIYRY